MAMAPGTYGAMQYRIADELGARTDLLLPSSNLTLSPIQMAIQDAIEFWDDTRFFWNEFRYSPAFTTVLGQEFYTATDWPDIKLVHQIDEMTILYSGNRYKMWPRTAEYIEEISTNTRWNGLPVDYSYYNYTLRFYPIPNGAYPINILGTRELQPFPLTADTDTNDWMTVGEMLIRAQAKMHLYRDTLQDDERAMAMAQAVEAAFGSLKGETQKRVPTTRMRPTYF